MSDFLIGKTVVKVQIAEDRMALRFEFDDGSELIGRCDADCCSHTWIENIEMPALGLPFKILEARDLELPEDMEVDYEWVQFYGLAWTTDKGTLTIDYRNESNGYYGGSISWGLDDEDFYGGVYGQNVSNMDWRDVE